MGGKSNPQGIVQEIEIRINYKMVYAQTRNEMVNHIINKYSKLSDKEYKNWLVGFTVY